MADTSAEFRQQLVAEGCQEGLAEVLLAAIGAARDEAVALNGAVPIVYPLPSSFGVAVRSVPSTAIISGTWRALHSPSRSVSS